MRHTCLKTLLPVLALFVALTSMAQGRNVFSINEFAPVPMDFAANQGQYSKLDSNGSKYAIFKISSTDPDDDLSAYVFNFGMMNAYKVPNQPEDSDELWYYVQKGARQVSITRNGFKSISNRDLGLTVEPGRVYKLCLSPKAKAVVKQWVEFNITPAESHATVLYQEDVPEATPTIFGTIDAEGRVAKNLPYGTYKYSVITEDNLYKRSEGTFVLNNRNEKKVEQVILRPSFAEVSLKVNADADIFVDEEFMGRSEWSGRLLFGNHNVSCRADRYKPTSEYIQVAEDGDNNFVLLPPVPIVGTLSVSSAPIGASISIDGEDYGTTPRSIDIIIGEHNVTLAKDGFEQQTETVTIKESDVTELDLALAASAVAKAVTEPRIIKPKQEKNETKKPATPAVKKEKPAKETGAKKPKDYLRPMEGYAQVGFLAGMQLGPTISVGGYIANVNIEGSFTYGVNSATLYSMTGNGDSSINGKFLPLIVGGKLGYGIKVGKRLRITPQAGFEAITASNGTLGKLSAGSVSAGFRVEYALTPNISVVAAPQGRFAVLQGDSFKDAAQSSSTVKGWGTGADCLIGVSFRF